MKNENKTKDQLIQELIEIQKKIADLEEIIIKEKRVKAELKESEKKYKDLVEETPIGIANIGIAGKIIYINQRLEKISGYSREEVLGKNVFKLGIFPDEMLKILKERLKVRLRGGLTHQRREIPFKCKDGKWIWIEITAKLIKKWGIPASLRITVQDITERKKAEEELKNSEERLKILFDYAPDAYYINDLKGNFIDGNKAAERVVGYKREELIGSNFLKLKLLSLANIPKAAKTLAKNILGQSTGPDEFILNRKNNSKVTVEVSTYPVKIKGKTLVLGIARNITERKQAEEKEKEHHKNIELLSKTAIQFVEFPQDKDIYTFIGEKLKDFTGKNSIIIVNSIDTEKDILATRTVLGLGKLYDTVAGLLGKHPVGTIYNATDESLSYLSDGKLHLYKEGLYGILLKTVPKTVCNSIEKLFNVKRIYTIGFTKENKLFGTAVIFFKEGAGELKNKQTIETFIKQASIAIQRRQAEERLKNTMDATIETMSKIIEIKDPYTAGHQQRVSQLTTAIAKELNLSQDRIGGIRITSLIHDIGKISVPTEILSKTTTLSDIEFSLIKGHSQAGSDILKAIDFSYPVANIVLQHHERLDGSGYPNNLKGDKILLEARILGVADVVEAISSHRPYRPSLGINAALEEISQNKGTLYDSEVVDVCLELFKEKDFEFKL